MQINKKINGKAQFAKIWINAMMKALHTNQAMLCRWLIVQISGLIGLLSVRKD
jgi:hypothetical protein